MLFSDGTPLGSVQLPLFLRAPLIVFSRNQCKPPLSLRVYLESVQTPLVVDGLLGSVLPLLVLEASLQLPLASLQLPLAWV